jgi:hypothetical protein
MKKLSDNSHFITLQIDGQSPNLFSSRTEQLRKLGNLKLYYLDEFNQTGVFICHKRGMRSSVAVGDRGEGSLLLGLC